MGCDSRVPRLRWPSPPPPRMAAGGDDWMDDAMCERIEQQAARIRELEATIARVRVLAERGTIRGYDLREALDPTPEAP